MRYFICLLLLCISAVGYLNKDSLLNRIKASSQDSAKSKAIDSHNVEPYPILTIRHLLVNENYEKLNAILEEYQAEYEKNVNLENNLFDSYVKAFYFKNSGYEPLLDKWVKNYPKHYQPYLARASFFYGMAWDARGGKFASETSKSQFEGMQHYFDKVNSDVKQALSIKQDHIVPYYFLINIHKAVSESDTVKTLIKLALAKCPNSFRLRSTYLLAIAPRWGGNYEEMRSFAEESQKYLFRNPKIAVLQGYTYYEAAHMEYSEKNYGRALELVDKAIVFGDSMLFYDLRARLNKALGKYEDALKDIDMAVALEPQDSDTYERKARILGNLNKLEESIENIGIAERLSPNEDDIVEYKAWLASKYYAKARTLIDQKDFSSAQAELDRAININRTDIDYYRLMDWLLAKQSNWDSIIGYWDQYLALKPKDDMAYMERGGAYFHKGDIASAVADAKRAADLGNEDGKKTYDRYKGQVSH